MKLNNKKLLIFDYDGTIADTNLLHEKAFREVLKSTKIKFKYKEISGMKTIDAINNLLNKNKIYISKEKIDTLVTNKQKIFRTKINKELKPISGVIDFLNWAKPRFYLCVASSGSKINVFKGLKILRLFNYFKYIFCSEDVKSTKPSPEIFLKVLSEMNLNAEEALIFEDSDKGIESAKNANIDFIDIRNNPFTELLIYIDKNGYL